MNRLIRRSVHWKATYPLRKPGLCFGAIGLLIFCPPLAVSADEPAGAESAAIEPAAASTEGAATDATTVSAPDAAPVSAEPNPDASASNTIEDLSLEQLMDLKVTTVSRQDSTVGQSAAAVFVITQEMIRRSGATTIPELFRMVPGMQVAQINSNQWAISARGFNNDLANKLLVQIDGRTLYSPIYSGVYWDTVDYPLQDIERIEVVRGPGASVWGANAVNGIINIITKAAKDTQGGTAEVGVGTEARALGSFRYGGKSGDEGFYRVYGKGAEYGGGRSPIAANDDWRRGQAGFRLDKKPSETSDFTLQGDFFSVDTGKHNVYAGINNPPSFVLTNNAEEESVGGNLLARWTHNPGENNGWTLQAYYDRFDRHATNKMVRTSIETADIDYQRQMGLGKRHRLVYGLGYRRQKTLFAGSQDVDNSFVFGPQRTVATREVWSAFLQDEIKLGAKVALTLGSKVEHNDYTGVEVQPSGRILWTPSKRQSVWASLSRAVRTPSLLENDIRISIGLAPTLPIFLQLRPNTQLNSEEVLAHELGYRIQATDNLSFDTALFYNDYKRLISFDQGATEFGPVPGTFVVPLMFQNNLKGHSYGAEVAANYNPSKRLKLTGAYTFTRINLTADPSVPVAFRSSQEDAEGQTPRHQLFLKASLDLPRNLQFDLATRLVGPLPRLMPAVPGYTAVDARIAWKPSENLEYAIVGQNLFSSHHLESSNATVGSVELQRAVYGSVTFKW